MTWWNVGIISPLLCDIIDGKQGEQPNFGTATAAPVWADITAHVITITKNLDDPNTYCNVVETKAISNMCKTGSVEDLMIFVATYCVNNVFNCSMHMVGNNTIGDRG
jgi:hypothetical protein